MPKTVTKKVYTFEQLDEILCRRGERGRTNVIARLRGNVFLLAPTDGPNHIRIQYNSEHARFEIARVWKVAGEGTAYKVYAYKQNPSLPASQVRYRSAYKNYVNRLTPHTLSARGRLGTSWCYRVDTAGWHGTGDWLDRVGPADGSRLYPECVTPSPDEWLGERPEMGTEFERRSRAFWHHLRREIDGSLPCSVQLLNQSQAASGWSRPSRSCGPSLCLHVCTPPVGTRAGRRLLVCTSPHAKESRTFFHVDGDYGLKYSQFAALEIGSDNYSASPLRWPRAKDAIAGIREWLLSTVYIPGPM
jgi:hypothetical protein